MGVRVPPRVPIFIHSPQWTGFNQEGEYKVSNTTKYYAGFYRKVGDPNLIPCNGGRSPGELRLFIDKGTATRQLRTSYEHQQDKHRYLGDEGVKYIQGTNTPFDYSKCKYGGNGQWTYQGKVVQYEYRYTESPVEHDYFIHEYDKDLVFLAQEKISIQIDPKMISKRQKIRQQKNRHYSDEVQQ